MRAYPATSSLAKYLPGRPRAASRRRPHPPMLHALPRPADLRLPATFGSLRHRDYRIWWFGLLVSLVRTWMQRVGPAGGGVRVARFGVGSCVLLTALSVRAGPGGLGLLRPRPLAAPGPGRRDLLGQLGEGLAFVRRTPAALLPLALMGVVGTLGYNFSVVLPLLARFALGTGPGGFGALTAAMGVGSLVGALVVASCRRTSLRVILLGAAAFSLLAPAVAAAHGSALAR